MRDVSPEEGMTAHLGVSKEPVDGRGIRRDDLARASSGFFWRARRPARGPSRNERAAPRPAASQRSALAAASARASRNRCAGGACGLVFGFTLEAFAATLFCWVLVVITRTDFEHRLIPDKVVSIIITLLSLSLYPFYSISLLLPSLPTPPIISLLHSFWASIRGPTLTDITHVLTLHPSGSDPTSSPDPDKVVRARRARLRTIDDPSLEWILSALGAGLVLFLVVLVYPSGLGMGDVKLSAFSGPGSASR